MTRPISVLFLNENIGGHVTVHEAIRYGLTGHENVAASFAALPGLGPLSRGLAARVPLLGPLDLDLQPLRAQLLRGVQARRILAGSALEEHDVLHVYTQTAALLSVALLRTRPTVVTTDATGDQVGRMLPYRKPTRFTPLTNRVRHPFEERVFGAAVRVVAKSEWAARALRAGYGVPEEKLRVVPLGVRIPDLPREPGRLPLPQVTFVGSTMERKGGNQLVRVFRRSLRGTCELNLVTRDRVAPEPGVRVYDDFVPGDHRLTELLARTSVFALPTEMDSYGNAVLEAMAMGVPVVVTRCGAIPELVEDGVSGLLVEPDDRALSAALQSLIADEQRRTAMGAAARRRVLRCFDARDTTARLVEVLQEARECFPPARPVRRRARSGVGTGR